MNKLVKDAYTGAAVRLDDIIEPIGGAPGIQYMLDRTLLRPRDIIAFFNLCIEQASDDPKITRQMILAAEREYSNGRLRAIADEWRGIEPLVVECARILQNRRANIRFTEITDEEILDLCQQIYLDHHVERSEFLNVAKRHAEAKPDATASHVRVALLNLFYKIGLVSVKPNAQEKFLSCSDGPPSLDGLDVDENCSVRVQMTFRRALNTQESNQRNQN